MFKKNIVPIVEESDDSFRSLVNKRDSDIQEVNEESNILFNRSKKSDLLRINESEHLSSEYIHIMADEFRNDPNKAKYEGIRPESIIKYRSPKHRNKTISGGTVERVSDFMLLAPPDLLFRSRSNSFNSQASQAVLEVSSKSARPSISVSNSKSELENNLTPVPAFVQNNSFSIEEYDSPAKRKIRTIKTVRKITKKLTDLFKHRKSIFQPDIEGKDKINKLC